jgi:hypothetical protein
MKVRRLEEEPCGNTGTRSEGDTGNLGGGTASDGRGSSASGRGSATGSITSRAGSGVDAGGDGLGSGGELGGDARLDRCKSGAGRVSKPLLVDVYEKERHWMLTGQSQGRRWQTRQPMRRQSRPKR